MLLGGGALLRQRLRLSVADLWQQREAREAGRESGAPCGTLSEVGARQCSNSWHMGNRTSASGPGFKSQRD